MRLDHKNFHTVFPKEFTLEELWTIVKLCKHVRLRCRSNVAFNNFFNALFEECATFTQVTKHHADGTSYPGLEIKLKRTGDTLAQPDEQ